jgi:hypothetical protein
MGTFDAKCTSSIDKNGIVKVLLTVESVPSSQDEHMLCNLLRSRVDFKQGDTVEVTIRKVTR